MFLPSPTIIKMNLYIAFRGHYRGQIFDRNGKWLERMDTRKIAGNTELAGYDEKGLALPFSALEEDIIRFSPQRKQIDERFYELTRS